MQTEKQGVVGKILEVDYDHLAQPQLGCLFPREDEARAKEGAAADGNDGDVCVRSGNRMGRSSTRAALLRFQDEDEEEDKEETNDNSP